MVEIIWSELALKDLKSIHDYIAEDSLLYAERYINVLMSRVDILIKNPLAGRFVPEFQDKKLRQILEGSYRIIYRTLKDNKVAIVRIHHSSKLLKRL